MNKIQFDEANLSQIGSLPVLPQTLIELKSRLSDSITAIRYDGNLFGPEWIRLTERVRDFTAQLEPLDIKSDELIDEFSDLNNTIKSSYPGIELTETRVLDHITKEYVLKIGWDHVDWLPPSLLSRWNNLLEDRNSYIHSYNETERQLRNAWSELKKLQSSGSPNTELARLTAQTCAVFYNTNGNIFEAIDFSSRELSQNSANPSAIFTPTIVVSRDIDLNYTGGHNVQRQLFSIEIDSALSAGEFRFSGPILKISAEDISHSRDIVRTMASLQYADPLAQSRAFSDVLEQGIVETLDRSAALKVVAADTNLARISDGEIIRPRDFNVPEVAEDTIRLGWGENHMYFDQRVSGETARTALINSEFGLPSLISARIKGYRVARIEFEDSISARDRDNLITDFVREKPLNSGGDGGWRLTELSSSDGPRLIRFIDNQSGGERLVVETQAGRAEFVVARDVTDNTLLERLATEIESGAEIDVTFSTLARTNSGQFLVSKFKVLQNTEISGTVAVKMLESNGSFTRTIIDAILDIIRNVFQNAKGAQEGTNTLADVLIELKYTIEGSELESSVRSKFEVHNTIMRFILYKAPEGDLSSTSTSLEETL